MPFPRSADTLRRSRRGMAFVGALLVAVVLAATTGVAGAHVSARLDGVDDTGIATVTFTFDHGCDGEPTTSLRVLIPEGVAEVAGDTAPDGWTFATDGTEFGWSGGSVPDGDAASFTATMRVWGQEGDTIWLRTVQGCPNGEEAWIEIQEPGQPEPPNVAPSIVLPSTFAAPATTAEPTTPPTTAEPTTTSTFANVAITEEGSPQNNVGLVVGGIAVGAIVIGALVLYLRHRQPRTD
jgi:uncharacterized protein YcnI